MFKNLSIRWVTILISLIILTTNVIILWILSFNIALFESHFYRYVLLLLLLVINYILIKTLLESYVFKRIKVIYKLIRDTRISEEKKVEEDLSKESIASVQSEVEKWAKNTQNEIATLKTLENYRKDYVGNISHELKTPIFSIQGYLHTLLEGGIYDNKINKTYIERAIKNVDRLQNIVEDLEAISKLESEAHVPEISKWDLKSLTIEIFDDLRALAKERGITIGFKDGASPAWNVKADREMIRQVINNLIVNAVKYGKENGEIRVSYHDLDKNVLMEITDDGMGIEEKHLKHLFDRFYRVDSSRSRKIGGSGLGLSIVKHIVESHDQQLMVRSKVGIGSTFGFTLEKG